MNTYENTKIIHLRAKLSQWSFKECLLNGVWRKKHKNGSFSYMLIEDMAPQHLKISIENAKVGLNDLIVEILEAEVARREKICSKKSNQIKNKMNNAENDIQETQSTNSNMIDAANTGASAAVVAASVSENAAPISAAVDVPDNNTTTDVIGSIFQPKFAPKFKRGQKLGANFEIDSVECTNGHGYRVGVLNLLTGEIKYMPQSRLLEKLGLGRVGAKKSVKKPKKNVKATKTKANPIVKNKILRNYNVGDKVGNQEVLEFQRSNKGTYGGYRYKVKNVKTGNVSWVKQSSLYGTVVPASKHVEPTQAELNFFEDIDTTRPAPVASSVARSAPDTSVLIPKKKRTKSRLKKIYEGIKHMFS